MEKINRSENTYKSIKSTKDVPNDGFVVGKMTSPFFVSKRRLFKPSNRGPFRSSNEYITAKIQRQRDWIRTGVEIANSEDPDEIDSDCDEDLIDQAPDMLNACNDVLEFVPSIFPPTETEKSYTLLRHDINPDNIILDPATHQIVGIIDWEMTCILPRWEAFQYPKLLIDIEPLKEEEPPIQSTITMKMTTISF